MMQIRWLWVALVFGWLLAGCAGSNASKDSENQKFNNSEPLSGQVFGKPWAAKTAALKKYDFRSGPVTYYIEIFSDSIVDICNPAPVFGKIRASVILKEFPKVGSYKNEITNPASTIEPLAFDDGQPSPTSYISEVTVLNILETNSAGFLGQLYSRSSEYEISGQFEFVNCLGPQ